MNNKFIPLSVPNLKGNELKYITNAIETEWVSTGGPYVEEFEVKTSEYLKTKGAVSCQSGTAGLHTAMCVTGITKDDMVIVPTLTFIAAVNPVKYVGAEPVFMDCDDSLCIDPVKLNGFCETECYMDNGSLVHKHTGKVIKAIVAVHVFGNMADMESIMKTAEKYNLKVIEDATEAMGTYYTEGMYVGRYAGTIGDIGVFSFNGNKIITTGGGGMIVSDNEEYLSHARHLTTQAKSDELYYIHDEIGFNYRMTNIQAALGIAQLEQLEEFIDIKNRNYELYAKGIEKIEGLELLPFRKDIRSNKWFYGINCEKFRINRDRMIEYLKENKIQSRPIWGLVSDQIPYNGSNVYNIEIAKKYWNNVVNIPCSTNLKETDVMRVVSVLENSN
ncbi:MAG: LegC family aminotransferase [Lachnospiraceae bacterium]|nr:LegC family aminotransferase [Lachnospiraceae bacterium]